jgi:hypothetical protein
MTAAEIKLATDETTEWTTCDSCFESVRIADTDDDCYCPACHATEEAAQAEDAREEAISDAQSDLDEADTDLEVLAEEMKDLKARIAEAGARKVAAHKRLAKLAK